MILGPDWTIFFMKKNYFGSILVLTGWVGNQGDYINGYMDYTSLYLYMRFGIVKPLCKIYHIVCDEYAMYVVNHTLKPFNICILSYV